ncbi:hypothetical protein P7F88_25210 [Vibrio hannami]|uniref:hypothetical protein n=1 Tax=Vibrio hannami TaxID=2717094 RepID=UPI00240F3768|nr:hypothetical protein [Vibrio hannami]MDG3089164.1 hypothetical protein [Vibrio hannami]
MKTGLFLAGFLTELTATNMVTVPSIDSGCLYIAKRCQASLTLKLQCITMPIYAPEPQNFANPFLLDRRDSDKRKQTRAPEAKHLFAAIKEYSEPIASGFRSNFSATWSIFFGVLRPSARDVTRFDARYSLYIKANGLYIAANSQA